MTRDTSGPALPEPSAFYDPDTSSWRTSQLTFEMASTSSSLTLPRWGTTRAGALYELPTPAPLTVALASSSLVPTPLHSDGGGPRGSSAGWGLRDFSRTLLKTPTAQLAVNGGSQHPDKRKAGGHGPTLADEVEHLLPTPRATDGEKGGPNQRGSSGDLMLPSAVQAFLPTPTARDWKGANQRGDTSCLHGALLPTPTAQAAKHSSDDRGPGTLDDFNLWSVAIRPATFSGAPTPPPSTDGKPSSVDQLPGQLSLDEPASD